MFQKLGVSTACFMPLFIHEKVIGVLMVSWEEQQTEKDEKEMQSIKTFVNHASLILGAAGEEEQTTTKKRRSKLLLDID